MVSYRFFSKKMEGTAQTSPPSLETIYSCSTYCTLIKKSKFCLVVETFYPEVNLKYISRE